MVWPLQHAVPASIHAVFPRPGTLGRNLGLDLTSALGLGSMFAVVGVLLPSIARREGLDSMGLAVLAALPFLASLVTLFAGRIGPRTPSRMALLRAAGAASLLLVLVAPDPLFIALAIFAFWIAFSLGAPMQQRIWAMVYPSRDRGRLLGYVGTARAMAGTTALLAIALVAASSGWGLVIAVVALVGAACSLAIGRMQVPGVELDHRFSARDSVRSVVGHPMLRPIAVAQLLYGAGFVAAPALIAMVHVDRLGLGVDEIALAGLLSYGSTALTFSAWGRFAGRAGGLWTMSAGTLVGTLAMAVLAVAPDFATLILGSVLLGAAGASVDVSWPLLIADHATPEQQSEVSAGMNSIMGLRGLVWPFVVMAPIRAGVMDETAGLFILAGVMLAGALLYARLSGMAAASARRATALRGRLQRRPAISEI